MSIFQILVKIFVGLLLLNRIIVTLIVFSDCPVPNAKYDPLCIDPTRDPKGGLGCNAGGIVGCRIQQEDDSSTSFFANTGK